MDEKWQDWHDSTLCPLLDHAPGEELSPELKNLLARDPTQVDLALLAADTDRTQSYVFESTKLPEIRGGSELLQRLNEGLTDIITAAGLPKDCVLYASGGGFLALVPASMADELTRQIDQSYPARTGLATITCVSRPVSPAEILFGYGGQGVSLQSVNALRSQATIEDWQRIAQAYGVKDDGPVSAEAFREQRGFGQMVRVMGNLLRQRKDRPPVTPVVEALPFAMRCRICQVRPAERMYQYFDEPWPLCDVCRRKVPPRASGAQEARSQQVEDFLDWLHERAELETRYLNGIALSQVHYAQDLNELGNACQARSGYIGFIYADGNRMGSALESLPVPQAYRHFSHSLQEAIRGSAFQALAENLHPTEIERVSLTGKPSGKGYIHPLEPLVIGGDDMMLIVPGDAALPVAVRVCQLFEREMQRQVPAELWPFLPADLHHPTISAGVVIADSHNPVRVLQQVSKELCKSAKRRAHDEEHAKRAPTSGLDFLLIKSQSMLRRDVKQLRQTPPYYYQENGRRTGRYLTAAPYTLDESIRLLKLLKLMRHVDFPTSQLQGLVAALQRGRRYGSIHYLYQEARLKARLGEGQQDKNILARLEEIWSYDDQHDPIPWHRAPGKEPGVFASILPDLLELYPFVPESDLDGLWDEIFMEADYGHPN